MEKRGQIFLIAALITIGALIGLTSVVNTARGGSSNEEFFSKSDEIKFESKRVLDYGVFYEGNTETLVKQFLEKYADYIARERVLFIFGDERNLWGLYFVNNTLTGSVNIKTGGQGVSIPMQGLTNFIAEVARDPITGDVFVKIDDVVYTFPLQKGKNLFFVIVEEENDQAFASAG